MWKKIYNKLNLKSPKVQVWYFAIIPFIIILIWCFVSIHIKENEIVEQEIKKQFTKDSLKIINDSLQKVYVNSSHYVDSIKDYNETVELYKNDNFLYSFMKIETKQYNGNKIVLKYDGKNCGDYEACNNYIKEQCKYKTSSTTDLILGKINYTEYKICLEMASIEEINVPYSYDYVDTTYSDKHVEFNNVKIVPSYFVTVKANIKFIDKETNQVIKTCRFGKEKHCKYNYKVSVSKLDNDITKLMQYKGFSVLDIEKIDPDLIKNLRLYRAIGLLDKNDVAYILDSGDFPYPSLLSKSWDSLERISNN